MMKSDRAQYHCCFLIEKANAALNMAIAWRRTGACDYGVYLTKRCGSEDLSPMCTVFKASYSTSGKINSFMVSDRWVKNGDTWDEDHLNPFAGASMVSNDDARHSEILGRAFFGEWLEPFGAADAFSMLKDAGLLLGPVEDHGLAVLSSGLPAAIKKNKLPDVLSCAEANDHGLLYSFIPFPERLGGGNGVELLENKMRMFFELL